VDAGWPPVAHAQRCAVPNYAMEATCSFTQLLLRSSGPLFSLLKHTGHHLAHVLYSRLAVVVYWQCPAMSWECPALYNGVTSLLMLFLVMILLCVALLSTPCWLCQRELISLNRQTAGSTPAQTSLACCDDVHARILQRRLLTTRVRSRAGPAHDE
jgi:hypothetical protein